MFGQYNVSKAPLGDLWRIDVSKLRTSSSRTVWLTRALVVSYTDEAIHLSIDGAMRGHGSCREIRAVRTVGTQGGVRHWSTPLCCLLPWYNVSLQSPSIPEFLSESHIPTFSSASRPVKFELGFRALRFDLAMKIQIGTGRIEGTRAFAEVAGLDYDGLYWKQWAVACGR